MLYDVRLNAVLDGIEEIYTIIPNVEAGSPEAAAQYGLSNLNAFEPEDWWQEDGNDCVFWEDGLHTVRVLSTTVSLVLLVLLAADTTIQYTTEDGTNHD